MKNLKKLLTVLLSVCIILTAFSGCISKVDTVAEVNGEKITEENYVFQYYLGSTLFQVLSNVGLERGTDAAKNYLEDTEIEEGKTAIELCKEEALNATVRLFAELQKAKEEGLTITDEDREKIKSEDNYYIQMVGGEDAFNKHIESLGITREDYDKMSENFTLSDKLQKKFVTVTDEEVEKAIKDEEYISAKHILFMTVDAATNAPLSEEEIAQKKEIAQMVLSEIRSGGDFDALMNEFSEDPGLQQSPDGYTFKKGEMVKPFEDASYALEENKVSDIVESDFGYHIIKRIPLMDEFKADKKASVQTEKYIKLVDEWVEKYNIKKFEKALKGVEY